MSRGPFNLTVAMSLVTEFVPVLNERHIVQSQCVCHPPPPFVTQGILPTGLRPILITSYTKAGVQIPSAHVNAASSDGLLQSQHLGSREQIPRASYQLEQPN